MTIRGTNGPANEATGAERQSAVGACEVSVCRYNSDGQCLAGTIHIAFVDGMAHCATFAPDDDSRTHGTAGGSADIAGPNTI